MEDLLVKSFENESLAPPLTTAEQRRIAAEIRASLSGMRLYPRSLTAAARALFGLARNGDGRQLVIVSATPAVLDRFPTAHRSPSIPGGDATVAVTPASWEALQTLQAMLPYLKPDVLGLAPSAGCGDRLGLATPGHLQAVARSRMAPILAQQSVRENERTGRTPQDVMRDAAWGVFQEGWRQGFGADADHLKTTADVDAFAAAGFTFFTVDPGDHVDARGDDAANGELAVLFDELPWHQLESTPADLTRRLTKRPVELDTGGILMTTEDVQRAAVKYGRVIAQTVSMYRHLVDGMAGRPFELEVSVDETDTVTSLAEHIYIASDLKRLGVQWVSLAPRYVGTFEKGVDYIGDLDVFAASFEQHAAVARAFGPYKLSLHSGSDKFSIYPIAARLAGDHVHLKTAGTSYLEALRAVARVAPEVFRRIVNLAVERYPVDRASYHVSAGIAELEPLVSGSDEDLGALLDDFHGREILHVTYGSVLNHPHLSADLFEILRAHEDLYTELIAHHFDRHLKPFGNGAM
jgi:hypothetical protein